jgi:hypothetical protein
MVDGTINAASPEVAGVLIGRRRVLCKRRQSPAYKVAGMAPSALSPVKMIGFLLVGHSQPPVPLSALVSGSIFNGRPPQSIAELSEERYAALKGLLQLGLGA